MASRFIRMLWAGRKPVLTEREASASLYPRARLGIDPAPTKPPVKRA